MGKKEDRQLIGLRMRASEIKRRRHELDERYGLIDGICPICGKLIRKPKRGPMDWLQCIRQSDEGRMT